MKLTSQAIVTALETLLQYDIEDYVPRVGVCGHLINLLENRGYDCLITDLEDQIGKYSKDWEYYSGDSLCPIPSVKDNLSPMDTYYSTRYPLWEGKQLTYRISFMKHLIKKLKG